MTKQLFQPRDTRAVSLLFSNSVGFLLLRLGVAQDQRTDLNTRVVSVLQDKVPATPLHLEDQRYGWEFYIFRCLGVRPTLLRLTQPVTSLLSGLFSPVLSSDNISHQYFI